MLTFVMSQEGQLDVRVNRRMRFLFVCLSALDDGIRPPQRLPGQNLSMPPPLHQRVREATQRNQTSPHSRMTLAARRCSCQPDFFFYYGRTDSFMSALAVAFTETPKETVFTDPQRGVNGVPLFFFLYLRVRGHAGPLNWLFLVQRPPDMKARRG